MTLLTAATVIAWLFGLLAVIRLIRDPSLLAKARSLCDLLTCIALGCLFGMLLFLFTCFQAFSKETLIAQVKTERLSGDEFELTYIPADKGPSGALRARLQGDQWSIGGGIVKWHPWLTSLGFESYHKPMRLSGQFSDLNKQRSHLPSVYSLDEPWADWLWQAFYWSDRYLPFVEAVYGSAAYAYVEPGSFQEVYITPSGYLIKRSDSF